MSSLSHSHSTLVELFVRAKSAYNQVCMVRLNKNELSTNRLEDLFKQLSKLLSNSSDRDVGAFLEQLLGPEERIMLAKRLAIAVLLKQDYSHQQIADTLHLSQSTITNLEQRIGKGGIKKIHNVLERNESALESLGNLLEEILTVGGIMPKRVGLDRYRYK